MILLKFVITLFCFLCAFNGHSVELNEFFKEKWNLNKESIKNLENGKIVTDAIVNSNHNVQSFALKASAIHPKSCSKALRKISMFEMYSDWISFINFSHYDEKNKLLTLKANHVLLPYPMLIHIIVDRPTKSGKYPFIFPTGMFKGLTGEFEILKYKNSCLFYAHSNWKGPKTKLPNFVIELFAETLSRIGGEILIRKTQF